MSYYHIKNLKIIKTENGYNAEANIADSSVYDWNDRLIWKKQVLYKNDFETKEKIEYALFEEFLDGNLQGSCGKFAPLNYKNQKIALSQKEQNLINKLDKKAFDFSQSEEKRKHNYDRYKKIRYSLSYRAWKLAQVQEKNNKFYLTYKGQNVVGFGARNVKFNYWQEPKMFKGLAENNPVIQKWMNDYPNCFEVHYI